jgi:CRISPR-associated protein Cas1
MIRRALEITGDGRHLRKEHGFLIVSADKAELARLPLDDLEVVMFAGHGMTCTGELLNTLAERCIPFIVCDQRFVPKSVLWSVESHSLQSCRIRAQAQLSAPTRKRLWQQLIRAKITAQTETLLLCRRVRCERLGRLAKEVTTGDGKNHEGQAARIYWPQLFGPDFLRDRDAPGVNALLNYGYTVLRSAVARAVMLAGLHPAFSLHHHNQYDTMPLVDDLIEPFRSVVDLLVYDLAQKSGDIPPLDPPAKQKLATVTTVDMLYNGVSTPVSECLLRMTRSLAEVCEGERQKLQLPSGLRPTAERLLP